MKIKLWMLKGMLLGTVFFIAALVIKAIGVSTQFSMISELIYSGIQRKTIENPLSYDLVFLVAIPIGAFLAHHAVKRKKRNTVDYSTHAPHINHENTETRAYVSNFIGGFLLLYGAGMANGCTSEHIIGGIMQGAVSGYLFAAAVLVMAIPTALLMRARSRKRGEY